MLFVVPRFVTRTFAATLATALVATSAHAATIVADFEGAAGTPDHFPGVAGNGWATAWNTVNGMNVEYTATVANTTPLNASPNYLSVNRTGGTASGTVVVRRVIGTLEDVNPALPHRVAFQFRFDGNFTEFSESFSDRINLFADPGGVNTTATSNAWMIGVASAGTASNTIPAPNSWFFFDAGNESTANAFTGANLVGTGIALVPGLVYDFTVDVYPSLGKYDATVSDGTNSFTGTDLQFRNGKTSTAPLDIPDTLHFGIGSSAAADNHAFSIDALTVTAIPEPASLAWIGLGVTALLRRRR